MRYTRFLCAILLVLLPACRQPDGERVSARAAEFMAELPAEQAYDALLRLDAQYPDHPCILIQLARAALQLGRHERAEIYLDRAAAREVSRRCNSGSALLDEALAELAVAYGDYDKAILHASAALAAGGPRSLLLLRARASLARGDFVAAVGDYHAVAEKLAPGDYDGYVAALAATDQPAAAIGVLHDRQRDYGYAPGQGVRESALYQQLGREAHAVAAALMEAEHLRYHHGMPAEVLIGNLSALRAVVSGADALQLLDAYRQLVAENWAEAAARLAEPAERIDHVFVSYAVLVSRLRSGAGGEEDLAALAALEPLFISSQHYYFHLWQVLSREAGAYSILTARELLERAILLSPGSHAGLESRRELGRLLGLSARQADLLLLGPELEALEETIVRYRDLRPLETLLEALSLPESAYTVAAMLTVKQLARLSAVRDYLRTALSAADGPTAARLRLVLSE